MGPSEPQKATLSVHFGSVGSLFFMPERFESFIVIISIRAPCAFCPNYIALRAES